MANPEITELLSVWTPYIDSITNWQTIVDGITPKPTGCGPVYELDNPINDRPNESFAIADMRTVKVAEPHYHPNGETEIYIVLTGLGRIVVGGKESEIAEGSVIVTPPDIAHFTIPKHNLVLAVINTPPFNPANYVPVTQSDSSIGFDRTQFDRLTSFTAISLNPS